LRFECWFPVAALGGVLLGAALAGCGGKTGNPQQAGGEGANAEGPSAPAGDMTGGSRPGLPDAGALLDSAGVPQLPAGLPGGVDPSEVVRIPAEPGVWEQGRSLQGETGVGGMIVQPARTLFAVKERLTFDMVKANLDRFQALEGRTPNSHDEFMQKIVKEGGIKLPRLPEGQRFVYDPERKELMVEGPAR
jgi:hypothetical protein